VSYSSLRAYELFKLTGLARFHWLRNISRVTYCCRSPDFIGWAIFGGSRIAVAHRISLAGQDLVVLVLLSLAGFHWLGKIRWFSFCSRPPDFIGWEGFDGSRIADLVQRLLKWIWRGSPFC
jgi:hypothetical protein